MVALLVLAGALAVGGAAIASGPAKVSVKPRVGGKHTTFTVSFTAPQRSGRHSSLYHSYVVSAREQRRASGCDSAASRVPKVAHAGQRAHVALKPRGSGWCAAAFDGSVKELTKPSCRKPPCPQWIRVTSLGTFGFTVKTK